MKTLLAIAATAALLFTAWRAARRKRPRFDALFLAQRLGMELPALRAFEAKYRDQRIEKRGPYRSNSRSSRLLNIPDGDTMGLQRKINDRILRRLRVHPAVKGFEKGSSVAKNAVSHGHQAVVLKLDLVDFFGSTKKSRVEAYFRFIGWDSEAARILTRLTTHNGGLPQGAPTSPALSNRINYALDHAIALEARRRFGRYTRYADDITISFAVDSPPQVRGMVRAVATIARRYGYEVHRSKKLRVLRRHQSQHVTGLVVNDGPRLPRKTRRWLRAVEYRLRTGGPATLSHEQLQGWKAYQADVERIRVKAEREMREAMVAALAKTKNSLRGAAKQLDWPLSVLKSRMKYHGLWDAELTTKNKVD